MKKVIVSVLCLLVMCIGISFAGRMESTVQSNVSTGPATGDEYQDINATGTVFTLIIGSDVTRTLIKELAISNDAADVVTQTVTLWDGWTNGVSTAAVAKIWEVTIGSGAVQGGSNWIYSETFEYGDRGFLKADNGLGATKSSTAGNVRISIQYK